MAIEGLAGGSRLDAMHAAGQQLHAQVLLEAADLLTHRRLGNMQGFAGAGDIAVFNNPDEVA
ncbi:hypothetical protein D3C76_990920 [compost metagenome]